MKNIVNSYVRKFKEERRRARRAVALLLALALVVATGVTWQLHSTGVALTNETYCGQEEHTHTEECYASVLVCDLEESEGHAHSEDCYETVTTLVCGLEESEGHTHTEECYDEDGTLICGLEESEGHTHIEDCYETEQVLICELEESEGHTHTEECYEEQLICGLEEHTHTIDCMSDETADVETYTDWEATLPELTGVLADDIVAVAESQLGYTESTANFTLADDGETRKGYTRYGTWYGEGYEYVDWDATFAAFCLYYGGISEDDFPLISGAYAWATELKTEDLYADAVEYTPGVSDLVFFDTTGDERADRVGIVTAVTDSEITVIEGNSNDAVEQNTYGLGSSTILGYGLVSSQEADSAGIMLTAENGSSYNLADRLTAASIYVNGVEYDGTSDLDPSESYTIKLSVRLDRADTDSTQGGSLAWTYTFPDGVIADDVTTANIYDASNNVIGSYTVSGNVLTVTYTSAADVITSDLEITATWDTDNLPSSITWGNGYTTDVSFSEVDNALISLTKEQYGDDITLDDYTLVKVFKLTVTASGDIGTVTLTDEFTSSNGKFELYTDYYSSNYDYQYIESTSSTEYYADFTSTSTSGTTTSITIGTFDISDGETITVYYAVKISGDTRLEMDSNYGTGSVWSDTLTNTLTGSYTDSGDTVTKSVTATASYRPDSAWVLKTSTDTDKTDTVVPWKISINASRQYSMGGAKIVDTISTNGAVYVTNDSSSTYYNRLNSSGNTESTQTLTWVVLNDSTYSTLSSSSLTLDNLSTTYSSVKSAMDTAAGVALTTDNISNYIFTNSTKTAFVWFVPAGVAGSGYAYAYELCYSTDGEDVEGTSIANAAGAQWKEKTYSTGTQSGTVGEAAASIAKGNDGVYIGSDGNYYVDWTITVAVPAGGSAISGVYVQDYMGGSDRSSTTTTTSDWLVGLSSDTLDFAQSTDKDYLNSLTRSAFTIASTSTNSAVQEVVSNATTYLGAISGSGSTVSYVGTSGGVVSDYGQFKVTNSTSYADGTTWAAGNFGIWLGDLPEGGADGYSITISYTVQVNPRIVEQVRDNGSSYGTRMNEAYLYRWYGNNSNYALGSVRSYYGIGTQENQDVIEKQVVDYDADTGIVTYEIYVNPNCDYEIAGYNVALYVSDVLSIPGATYVDDSFAVYFIADLSSTPGNQILYNSASKTLAWTSTGGMENLFSSSYSSSALSLSLDNQDSGSSSFVMTFGSYLYYSSVDRGSHGFTLTVEGASENGLKPVIPMVITYQVQLPDDLDTSVYDSIDNTATIYTRNTSVGSNSYIDSAAVSYDIDSPMHKTLTSKPSASNGYQASFQIDIDTTDEDWPDDLEDASFTVTDTMSKTLQFETSGFHVYGIDASGNVTELDSSEYTAGYDNRGTSSNVLTVTINHSASSGYVKYRIVYTATVTGTPGSSSSYENTAVIDGTGITSETISGNVYIQKTSASGSSTTYQVVLNKYDGGNLNTKLSATFTLYQYASGVWTNVKTGITTDSTTGQATLDNSGGTTILKANTWYKLVETAVPTASDGTYQATTVYFYFGDITDDAYATVPDGAETHSVIALSGTLDIPNYKSLSVSVTKEWEDGNNQDGLRNDNTTVTIALVKNGTETGDTITLSKSNQWSGSFDNLAEYDSGATTANVYTVVEKDVPTGYTSTVTGSSTTGFTVTNTHTPATITISGSKTWVDDTGSGRPETITVKLQKLVDSSWVDVTDATATINSTAVDQSYTFSGLAQYDSGEEITYRVVEAEVPEGYISSGGTSEDNYNLTNTAGAVLPVTGGSGTWLYTLTGLTLCGAALVLYRKKKTT